MLERTYEFNWDIIGDLVEGRPNLGDKVDFLLYCLMLYTFMEVAYKKFGREEGRHFFADAGNIAGRFFHEQFLKEHEHLPINDFLKKLRSVLDSYGVGFIRVDSVDLDKEEFSLSVATDMSDTDLPFVNIVDTDYEAGFIKGILLRYTGKEFTLGTVNTSDVHDIEAKMGDRINLIPYRMLQYTVRDAAEQCLGTEACDQLFYEAGEIAGQLFFKCFLEEFKGLQLQEFVAALQRILRELGVGVLRIEKADADDGHFVLTVSEDLDCSGLPDLGIEVCNYDEGFIAGIFHQYMGVPFKVKEVDCWCSGDRTCRFAVNKI